MQVQQQVQNNQGGSIVDQLVEYKIDQLIDEYEEKQIDYQNKK